MMTQCNVFLREQLAKVEVKISGRGTRVSGETSTQVWELHRGMLG